MQLSKFYFYSTALLVCFSQLTYLEDTHFSAEFFSPGKNVFEELAINDRCLKLSLISTLGPKFIDFALKEKFDRFRVFARAALKGRIFMISSSPWLEICIV